ncbi:MULTISPECIES: recombinase family protein [Sphingomonas]|jgi:DNA invertase Pin-like site-specific DNA recombinase|uniref:Resolvase n=1 Tax=Sphingomonas hankookensis TaxID=563996 RepID=A0ABR5Y9R2_9SPHN|nr:MULTISPECIES: recombinase family protein [Sphingomonas]KZE11377.1 resolvase [Sphingomonas hankookensis]PZT90879.1 MAG: resolvase [Sphingomonas sp.]WCP72048.1 recombinase family protein [Sphingomonas hankookensis]WCP72059.1 recombinase family protein [Sphingomonas hankookensis]
MTKRVALYTRVSQDSQTTENQRRELMAVAERLGWEVVAEFCDHGISGSKGRDKRPGYDALMKAVARREIDMVASWAVDRLGRSLQNLVTFLTEINAKGVDLYLHQQALDTSTPSGRAMFGMLSVFADFEREMIISRIKAGLARSTKRSGRPPLDAEKVERIKRSLTKGVSINATAKKLKVGVATVHRVKQQMALAA